MIKVCVGVSGVQQTPTSQLRYKLVKMMDGKCVQREAQLKSILHENNSFHNDLPRLLLSIRACWL